MLALAIATQPLPLRARQDHQPQRALCPGTTPSQVIDTYFTDASHHQVADARACLESHFRAYYSARVADPAWLNLRRVRVDAISLLGVNPAERPCCVAAPTMLYLASVAYDASFRRIINLENGRHRRYLFVGRRGNGPWRIYGFLTDITSPRTPTLASTSFVSPGATRLEITERSFGTTQAHALTTRPKLADQVVNDLNSLPLYPRHGPMACPADYGLVYLLLFHHRDGREESVSVDATGCQGVTKTGQHPRWMLTLKHPPILDLLERIVAGIPAG